MTFLGLEKPVEYQRQQIFDPTTANMVLNAQADYVNAMYQDYLRGLEDMKEFNKNFGDFMSPIQKDMDWYDKNVTGKVRNFINNMYANGIDPLRSAEGRAAVSQLIYSMPTGDIAKVRQSAETAKEYLKSFDDDTNPELEKFLGRDLSTWQTIGDDKIKGSGVWGYNKASKYQTIDDLIEPIVKNVDYTYDEPLTKAHNDGNNYYSITRDRLMQAVNDNMSDILATPSGAFHWEQAKKAAAVQGGGEELAKSIFNNMIGNRLSDHERVKFEADPFKLDDYRAKNDMRVAAYKHSLEGSDEDQKYRNVFREAEAYASNIFSKLDPSYFDKRVKNNKYNVGITGMHARYQPGEQYDEWVDPMIQSNRYIDKNKETGESWEIFKFRGRDIEKSNSVYVKTDNGEMHALSWKNGVKPNESEYEFEPEGNMVSVYNGKNYRYFIAGTLKSSAEGGYQFNNGGRVWIEAKEGMRRSMGRNKK